MQAITRRDDGIRISTGRIELVAPEARAHLAEALGSIGRFHGGSGEQAPGGDFPVPRAASAIPYVLSLRLLTRGREKSRSGEAEAIVLVRDPLSRNAAAARMLRNVFGLTQAEANLAQALQAGVSLDTYAQTQAISLNTVYTHLRRIKEKTDCHRLAELIRKLNDLQVPLRPE
jgi:DNA-binding CsgD family transcriptional regulator